MNRDPFQTLRRVNPATTSRAPLIDALWTRLHAEPVVSPAARAPQRRAAWRSRLAVALTVTVALAIVAGGVTLLRSPHRGAPAATPNVSSLTRILGVLRRPQTAADLTVVRRTTTALNRGLFSGVAANPTHPGFEPVRSLARAAARLPGGGRVGLIPVVAHPANAPARVGLAIFDSGGGGCCSTAAQIEAGQAYFSSGGAGVPNVLVLVVPDGVARVRYRLAHTVTVPVHDNVAMIRATVDGPGHHAMTWLAADGSVVKRFGPSGTATPALASVATQPGTWRGGANTCHPAAQERGLPPRAGCVSVVDADIDGDGRPDATLLYATLSHRRFGPAGYRPLAFWLVVRQASGGELRLRIHPTESNQFFLQHGNLNRVAGDELIVQTARISSNSDAVIYTDDGGRLRREPVTLDYRGDSASMGGFTCLTGAHPEVVQHHYELLGSRTNSPWRDTTTTYAWRGAALRRVGSTTTTIPHLAPAATTLQRSCGTLDVPRALVR